LPISVAAGLIGMSQQYLRRMARLGKLRLKGNNDKTLVLWEDLRHLVLYQEIPGTLVPRATFEADHPPASLTESIEQKPPMFEVNTLQVGHCIDWMRRMPKASVQAVVTSPPYWGVRVYEGNQSVTWADGSFVALGNEPTPDAYVRHSLEVLWHLKRVLKDDGVIWLNVGDTYLTRAVIRKSTVERLDAFEGRREDLWRNYPTKRYSSGHPYLKDKDLTLIPFHVALGAQRLGYWVRSIIVWAKDNTMPEPIKDRPTTAHEYVIMLAKSRRYFYNPKAAREPALTEALVRNERNEVFTTDLRNIRSVWRFATGTNRVEHTAVFPLELPMRCIEISTRRGDLVFDPFLGSGTTVLAADILDRKFFGCDISERYVKEARRRLEERRKNRKAQMQLPQFHLQ